MTVIVSAYYKIPSKQSHSFYAAHLRNFFEALTTQRVVFFTTPDVEEEIRGWGFLMNNITFIHLPFDELTGWVKGRQFWDRQMLRDPEKYHTPYLAVTWYEKRYFVRRAMDHCSDENIFIWCDAGCVRDTISKNAAAKFGTRSLIDLADDRIHLPQLNLSSTKKYYSYPYVKFACGFMAGTRTAWNQYIEKYEAMLDEYDSVGISGNSDQYVTASCIDRYPELFLAHKPTDYSVSGDTWFFFLHVL